MKRWIDATVNGVTAAHDRGEPLWRFTDPEPAKTPGKPPAPPAGPVYFITDSGCASACLDAADLWKGLGATQVGQETSADTLYMRSEEHTSELQSLMRTSYAVFCLKKKKTHNTTATPITYYKNK